MPVAILEISTDSNSFKGTISMNIYTSEKVMPYVYMCIHKETGEFYIGYRQLNIKKNLPSSTDLPNYKSSAKQVKDNFDKFSYLVIAEFFNPDDAYDFEQQLIYENWNDPLIINKSCYYGKKRFRMSGPRSKEHSAKIGIAHRGKIVSKEQRENSSKVHKGKVLSDATRLKISVSQTGRKHTEESKQKMRKPKPPFTEEHRRKISEASKRQIRQCQPIVSCPHCGTTGGAGTMPRWHFDRCKRKLS